MKIGKSTHVRSAICQHDHERIVVRGHDLAGDLIGKTSFTEYFHFLVTGKKASPAAARVLDAALVAITEHGLVPSNVAARMTFAAAPDAMQGAVAAGILGCGSVILGASEFAGKLLLSVEQEAVTNDGNLRKAAAAVVDGHIARKQPLPGFGHPEHKARDPRVDALFGVARDAGAGLQYIEIAHIVENVIEERLGRPLKLNVSGAIPAALLGVGFPVNSLKGIPILARTAGLIAHLAEELADPIGFAMAYQATREYEYVGPGWEPRSESKGDTQ